MNEPRDCYTEWNKSDSEKQISYDIMYMWNLIKAGLQMRLLIKQKLSHRSRKQIYTNSYQNIRRKRGYIVRLGLTYTCVCVHAYSVVSNSLWPPGCLPGSSARGILQARILEWAATTFSRGSSWQRDLTCISYTTCLGMWILYHWATWETLTYTHFYIYNTYLIITCCVAQRSLLSSIL